MRIDTLSSSWLRRASLSAVTAGLALTLASNSAWAQRPLKTLPAAARPPAGVTETPTDEKVPDPPGRKSVVDLLKSIAARADGRERVEAAIRGGRPENAGRSGSPGRGNGAMLNESKPSESLFARIVSWFVPDARAQLTTTTSSTTIYVPPASSGISIELTPATDAYGRHYGLYSLSPYAYVQFFGADVFPYYPSDTYVRLLPSSSNTSFAGGSSANSQPAARLVVNIPTTGWYTIGTQLYGYGGNVVIGHYEGRIPYTTLETLPVQRGSWTDYSTVEYLAAGYHYFSFLVPSGGYVSNISVDFYK